MKLVVILTALSITVTTNSVKPADALVLTASSQNITNTNDTSVPEADTVGVIAGGSQNVANTSETTAGLVAEGNITAGLVADNNVTSGSDQRVSAGPDISSTVTDSNKTVELITTTSGSLADGSVTTATSTDVRIASGLVTDGNVTTGSVTEWSLITGQVKDDNATVGQPTVGSATDGNAVLGLMTDGNLTEGSLTTSKGADGNVTIGQVADGNVTIGQVAELNITTGQVAEVNVTPGQGLDGNATIGQWADGNTTMGQGADGNVTKGTAIDLNATTAWMINQTETTGNITSIPVISPAVCDVRAGEQCRVQLFNAVKNVIGFSRLSPSARLLLPSLCQDYNATLRPCLTSSLRGCDAERRLNSAMIVAAMDFICLTPEGLTAVTDALPCYSNRSTSRDTMFCQQLTARSLLFNQGVCGATVTYVNCLANVYRSHCGLVASQAIQTILYKGTEPLRQMLHCPAIVPAITTTPTPITPALANATASPTTPNPLTSASSVVNGSSLSLRCYRCDSGDVIRDRARFDKNCVDGELGREYLGPLLCPSACYTRVRASRTGGVVRGCAAGLEGEFPGGVLPPRGCHRLPGGDWFCLCETHRCNRQDVERYITFELP